MASETTRLSSKGQVVIPARVRRRLSLVPGEELRVEVGSDAERTIVLRGQTRREIDSLIEKGYAWLERNRIDMVEALHGERRKARRREQRRR
jgi:AbrB family looped-hinge helix DNA binding protein